MRVVAANYPGLGFAGGPDYDERAYLAAIRRALDRFDWRIDAVLYVINAGRIQPHVHSFLTMFQERVMGDAMRHNSALIVNRCTRGWLSKPAQRANPLLRDLLHGVNERSFEFDLSLMSANDDGDHQKRSRWDERLTLGRQKSIDGLVSFLAAANFTARNMNMIRQAAHSRNFFPLSFIFG